jgi:hypothetical protein
MKKNMLIIVIMTFCIACDDAKVSESELEAAGQKLQKTVEKGADTLGSKLKKLANKVEDKLDNDTISD